MAAINKCSLQNLLTAVLGVANAEQNMAYPPWIFDSQLNTVTGLLISALVKTYPEGLDMLKPFIKTYKHAPQSGYFILPEDYRNKLGASINAKKDGSGECTDPPITNAIEASLAIQKAGCQSRPIEFLSESEWDYRTTSTYNYPTYSNPIGCFFDGNKFKVCPFDVGAVELRYVKQEQIYRFGYIVNPDDTFIFDPATSVESEWTSAAFELIFKALTYLYSAYTRDQQLTDWSTLLHNQGIL